MSLTHSLHHIVINTRMRRMTICEENCEHLYRYLWNILKERNCYLYRIGGIENHIHLLIDLDATVSLSDIVGELKRKSSLWMKRCGMFPQFDGWGREYFAFSKSSNHKDRVIEYIKNQKTHHKRCGFEAEIEDMVIDEGHVWSDTMLS